MVPYFPQLDKRAWGRGQFDLGEGGYPQLSNRHAVHPVVVEFKDQVWEKTAPRRTLPGERAVPSIDLLTYAGYFFGIGGGYISSFRSIGVYLSTSCLIQVTIDPAETEVRA
jgi:hypothetical protein